MTSISSVVEFLSSEFSCIEDITDEWVSSSTEGNYNDFSSISAIFTPSFYENDRATMRLRQLLTILAKFEEESDDAEIWTEMAKINISGKQLSVLLWYSIEWGLEKNSSFEQFERGALAACAYLILASIKDAKAYNIFNPHLYQKCLGMFRSLYRCLTYDARAAAAKSKSKGKGKSKKKQQNETRTEITEEGEETFSAASFDKEEVRRLLEESCEAMFSLLDKVSLSGYSGMSHETALLVRDLARIDIYADAKVDIVENPGQFKKLRKFCDRSFALMHRLIDERHSAGGYAVISRIIYPRLAFWTFECDVIPSSTTIPAVFTVWRDLMVKFIKIRAQIGKMDELLAIFKVLENLYQRCTDRLDYRTRLAQSVILVLQTLPRVFHFEFVQRIDRFSRTQKVAVRNFTCEIAPLVLTNFDLSDPDPGLYDEIDNVNKTIAQAGDATTSTVVLEPKQEELQGYSDEEDGTSAINSSSENDGDSDKENNQKKEKTKIPKRTLAQKEKPVRVPVLPALYTCIIRCCIDKASTVRIRAMFHLASLLGITEHSGQLFYHATKMFEESPRIFVGGFSQNEEGTENDDEEINEEMFLDDSEIVIENVMLHIILTGAVDDTAGVRKNSLMALQVFFPDIEESSQVENAVNCLKERCCDSSLMVRKQAAEVLDHLFSTCMPHRKQLQKGWLTAVLPMINDREQSVQQLVAQVVVKTILNPLFGEMEENSWKLLRAIELENNNRRLLIRALMHEYREGRVKSVIVDALNNKLDSSPEHSDVIWMLLADLSVIFKVKPQKAVHAWYALEDGDPNNRVRYVAKVLTKNSGDLKSDIKSDLVADLKSKISNFRIHAPNISSAYLCLAKLLDAIGEEGKGKKELEKFGRGILMDCRGRIRESLQKIEEEYDDADKLHARETSLIRMITTIGEIVQFSSGLMTAGLRHFDALKTVLASDIFNEEDLPVLNSAMPSLNPSPTNSRAPSPTNSVTSDGGSSQPTSTSSQGTSSSHGGPVIPQHIVKAAMTNRRALLTPRVRAHAVLTIGKFCLMDEKIAKATIPVFVKQLKLNSDHVIRNNIALVVCDLCIRYTLMVDRYSPIVAACLKDKSTLVRQQTLESLTSLIKEQFIRWEGQIMYRFVSTILDENKLISDYTKFCLRDVLLLQFPDLFESHFLECLMYFNNVPVSCEREIVQKEVDQSQQVCLYGNNNMENRLTIYKFMLSTFDDPKKFGLMAQICTQILCPLMNGKFKYENSHVRALVKDALTVMSLKEIKLNMDVGKGPDEEDEPPAAVVAVAKEIVTTAFRKAMLEYVMPTLLDLRVYLNERRSALRKELYAVFRVICREHKEKIDEFLDGDEQLKAEVEYDIRRYELREKAERAAAKRRAEEAAAGRRLSRRSLAIVRRDEREDDMNSTQSNSSQKDDNGVLEQGPSAQGFAIPNPPSKQVGRKSTHKSSLAGHTIPVDEMSSDRMNKLGNVGVPEGCSQATNPALNSSTSGPDTNSSTTISPMPKSSITTSPRTTLSTSLTSSMADSGPEERQNAVCASDRTDASDGHLRRVDRTADPAVLTCAGQLLSESTEKAGRFENTLRTSATSSSGSHEVAGIDDGSESANNIKGDASHSKSKTKRGNIVSTDAAITGSCGDSNPAPGSVVESRNIAEPKSCPMDVVESDNRTDTNSIPMEVDTTNSSGGEKMLGKENFREPGERPKRRTVRPAFSSKSETSVVTQSSKTSLAYSSSSEGAVGGRAASTPIKEIAELTFADLNLSAISSEKSGALSSRSRLARHLTYRSEVDDIEEEQ
ncbi:hypothetical protein RB195_026051 [Necator americanus]